MTDPKFKDGQLIVTPNGIGMVTWCGSRKVHVKFGADGPFKSFWLKTGSLRHATKAEIKAAEMDGIGRTPSKVDP